MTYKNPADAAKAKRRWKKAHPEKAYEQQHKAYRETAFAPNHGRRWSNHEDKRVLDRDVPDAVLVTELNRSLTAIQIRRCRLLGNDQSQPLIGKTTGGTDD